MTNRLVSSVLPAVTALTLSTTAAVAFLPPTNDSRNNKMRHFHDEILKTTATTATRPIGSIRDGYATSLALLSRHINPISVVGCEPEQSPPLQSVVVSNKSTRRRRKRPNQAQQYPWMESNDEEGYHYERMIPPEEQREALEQSHVVFGTLLQDDLVSRYSVYRRVHHNKQEEESFPRELVVADVKFGSRVNGHEGIVHGGILALLLDDLMGYAFYAMGIRMAFTANLNVDYRQPVPENTQVIMRVGLQERQDRKLYFVAQITSPDGHVLYVEATSLYIVPRNAMPPKEG